MPLTSISFTPFKQDLLRQFLKIRESETRLGEKLVEPTKAKYVIIGIEESIGPRANLGNGGAERAFFSFLKMFVNMQSNSTLSGENIGILGSVSANTDSKNLRTSVEEIDEFVQTLLIEHLSPHQIPIVIGGGHNNSYPIIMASKKRHGCSVDVINLDSHADYRPLEGRHSGNPFSYAYANGGLSKYTVLGLNERYNSTQTLEKLDQDGHSYSFKEQYLDGLRDWDTDIRIITQPRDKSRCNPLGIELDLDAIAYMPSSAFSPTGISLEVARQYIRKLAQFENVAYLHLPEGAPMNDREEVIVGKTLAFLVTDFLAVHSSRY